MTKVQMSLWGSRWDMVIYFNVFSFPLLCFAWKCGSGLEKTFFDVCVKNWIFCCWCFNRVGKGKISPYLHYTNWFCLNFSFSQGKGKWEGKLLIVFCFFYSKLLEVVYLCKVLMCVESLPCCISLVIINDQSFSSRQDRFLPIANVARIMKKAVPQNGKVCQWTYNLCLFSPVSCFSCCEK